MATIKSYTDLEQSKVLAEILPLESADMFYDGVQDLYKEKVYNIPTDGSSITVRTGHVITDKGIKANLLLPCWSLTALLSALPTIDDEFEPQIYRSLDKYFCTYVGEEDSSGLWRVADNPVDACYEMIIYLHELNLL